MNDSKSQSQAIGLHCQEVTRHPFTQGMPPRVVQELAKHSWPKHLEKGDLVFKQGDAASCFYLIVSGHVALTHSGLHGRQLIQVLGPGDAMGWSWLFPPFAWHFNAMCQETTRLIALDGAALRELVKADAEFGRDFMSRIAELLMNRLQKTRYQLFKLEAHS